MREDKEQAYRDGYAQGKADPEYRRDHKIEYVTGSASWAWVRGYEAAWKAKREAAWKAMENKNG